ncbi:ATP-binding protein [Mucisphaera calidilacus]|uniref:MalT-like TPR region domain-containing protein n=1 Tax=Mucisphaera calidilacus TaxID=2527982 RepID=A0A518BTR2_9BACT|nr:hypothetical protein [Mucisphaera calidilacus]QDU70349.1 hypothetical protein Pan265_01750 [Mucisphaera calidilacus]
MRRTCWLLLALLLVLPACRGAGRASSQSVETEYHGQLVKLAHEAMERGDADRAADLYLRRLEEARRVDDPEALVTVAAWAARAMMAAGRAREVAPILSEAELAADRLGVVRADLSLLRGASELREGEADLAIVCVEPILRGDIAASRDQQLDALLIAGHAEMDRGESGNAQLAWIDARGLAQELDEASAWARTLRLEARLARVSRDVARAAATSDQEAGYWRSAHRYLAMAHALHRAAQAYAEAGDLELASDRALRAGLSFKAQERFGEAHEALHLALAASGEGGDATRRELAERALEDARLRALDDQSGSAE